jgi:hypothetical protein
MMQRISARELAALREMQACQDLYLTLGELPRGVGRGIMVRLAAQGLVEIGKSQRFCCREAWRITLDGLKIALVPEAAPSC